jgi:hypothetical protein
MLAISLQFFAHAAVQTIKPATPLSASAKETLPFIPNSSNTSTMLAPA